MKIFREYYDYFVISKHHLDVLIIIINYSYLHMMIKLARFEDILWIFCINLDGRKSYIFHLIYLSNSWEKM